MTLEPPFKEIEALLARLARLDTGKQIAELRRFAREQRQAQLTACEQGALLWVKTRPWWLRLILNSSFGAGGNARIRGEYYDGA